MDPIDLAKLLETLKSMPEATQSEAMQALLRITDKIDEGDESAVNSLVEIAGCACMCDIPEMIRRFIVYQAENGPIAS